jgi:hypothetical protein
MEISRGEFHFGTMPCIQKDIGMNTRKMIGRRKPTRANFSPREKRMIQVFMRGNGSCYFGPMSPEAFNYTTITIRPIPGC